MIRFNGYYISEPKIRSERGSSDYFFIGYLFNKDGTIIRGHRIDDTKEVTFNKDDFKKNEFNHSYKIDENGFIMKLHIGLPFEYSQTYKYIGDDKFLSEKKEVIHFKEW